MPMHDWTRVEAGIFHAFHHGWIYHIAEALNRDRLPEEYYALPEHFAAGFGPDVLTLQGQSFESDDPPSAAATTAGTKLQGRPRTKFVAETDANFYRRKKKAIAIRHVSDDRIVSMIEIVSPGNKAGKKAFRAFVDKAYDLLEQRIHLLIVDPFPPGPRDPNGIHAAIWEELQQDAFILPTETPLTFAAYECDLITRAYLETLAVGDVLPDMPLFLEPDGCVQVPLEATYQAAFDVMPRRWRDVLQSTPGERPA